MRTLLLNTIRFNMHAAMFKIRVVVAILCGARHTLEAAATGSLQLRLLAEESGQFVAGLRGGRVHAHAARPSKQLQQSIKFNARKFTVLQW